MKQLTQKLRSGNMAIQELPIPQVGKGMVFTANVGGISNIRKRHCYD